MIEIPKKEPLNIVPFIDIMLVLLAMVLSISTFIAKGEIQIALPKSEASSAPAATEKPTLVQVDAAGTFFWDGKEIDIDALEGVIESLPAEERILLRIDKDSKFDHFIQVLDLFKKHRHENFSIATEKPAAR